MRLLIVLTVMLIVLTATVFGLSFFAHKDISKDISNNISKNISSEISDSGSAEERDSPADRISESQVRVYDDRVVIYIKNPEWATFTDTNSMDPVLDKGANAIQIVPKSEDEIKVGDIISYTSGLVDGIIIHRVIDVGRDEKGIYYVVKGDNNRNPDPEQVRFSQITRVLVAVVY